MSQLLNFLPIAIFVAVFFAADIYWATGALMIAVTLQVLACKLLGRPIARELLLTFWASLAFGGLTLALRDETFIQWKPSIVNWVLAALLLGGHVLGKNPIRKLLSRQLSLPERVWVRLNLGWCLGFFLAGVLNLVVAYSFSMEFWVAYKLVGGLALTFSYIVLTLIYLHRLGLLHPPLESDGANAAPTESAPPASAQPEGLGRAPGGKVQP